MKHIPPWSANLLLIDAWLLWLWLAVGCVSVCWGRIQRGDGEEWSMGKASQQRPVSFCKYKLPAWICFPFYSVVNTKEYRQKLSLLWAPRKNIHPLPVLLRPLKCLKGAKGRACFGVCSAPSLWAFLCPGCHPSFPSIWGATGDPFHRTLAFSLIDLCRKTNGQCSSSLSLYDSWFRCMTS